MCLPYFLFGKGHVSACGVLHLVFEGPHQHPRLRRRTPLMAGSFPAGAAPCPSVGTAVLPCAGVSGLAAWAEAAGEDTGALAATHPLAPRRFLVCPHADALSALRARVQGQGG